MKEYGIIIPRTVKKKKQGDTRREKMLLQLNAGIANSIIDVLVVVVILGMALISAKKGFVECLFSLISTIVAIILAFSLMKPFTNWTGGLFGLKGLLQSACTSAFSNVKVLAIDISNQGITEALADKDLPKFLIDAIIGSVGNEALPAGTTIAMLAGNKLGEIITALISWIAVFFLAKLLLALLSGLISKIIENLPIIGSVNTLLGFAVGLLKGLLIVSGLIAIISVLPIPAITTFFNNCAFVGWLYNNNPLNVVLGWILV